MRNQTQKDWGLTPFEMTLAALFLFLVYAAESNPIPRTPGASARVHIMEAGLLHSLLREDAPPNADALAFDHMEALASATDQRSTERPEISPDEARFLKQTLRQTQLRSAAHTMSEAEKNAVVRAASVTYERLGSLAEALGMAEFGSIDGSDDVERLFFESLEAEFGIPVEASRFFAQQQPVTLGDWAFFVQNYE